MARTCSLKKLFSAATEIYAFPNDDEHVGSWRVQVGLRDDTGIFLKGSSCVREAPDTGWEASAEAGSVKLVLLEGF